jgi:beta-glucosidase
LREEGEEIVVAVDVVNRGGWDGAQVVQVYVAQERPSVNRPVKELKEFAKVFVPVGQTRTAEVRMVRKYATSFWDEQAEAWVEESGMYKVLVGDSSANTPLEAEFVVAETGYWKGL